MQSKARYFANDLASCLAGQLTIKQQFSKVSEGANDNFVTLQAFLSHVYLPERYFMS